VSVAPAARGRGPLALRTTQSPGASAPGLWVFPESRAGPSGDGIAPLMHAPRGRESLPSPPPGAHGTATGRAGVWSPTPGPRRESSATPDPSRAAQLCSAAAPFVNIVGVAAPAAPPMLLLHPLTKMHDPSAARLLVQPGAQRGAVDELSKSCGSGGTGAGQAGPLSTALPSSASADDLCLESVGTTREISTLLHGRLVRSERTGYRHKLFACERLRPLAHGLSTDCPSPY